MRRLFAVSSLCAAACLAEGSAQVMVPIPQKPGVSPSLFNAPFYACTVNKYVDSVLGNDANPGTSAQPWQHPQVADNGTNIPVPGECINLVADSTPYQSWMVNTGGNATSSTGYVTWRCTTLDGCTVKGDFVGVIAGTVVFKEVSPMPSWVVLDGLMLVGDPSDTAYNTQGVDLYNPTSSNFASHHIWVLNSIISGYNQSGLQMNEGDYYYAIHNVIFNNSMGSGCGPKNVEGSGISFTSLIAAPGYTRVAMDNSNAAYANLSGFNNAILYNIVFNNAVTECGTASNSYDTDGNDIIADTFDHGNDGLPGGPDGAPTYAGSTLIAFNVTYNAGGGAIKLFRSENITVANNSAYNGYMDPFNDASGRATIGDYFGANNVLINNLIYSVPQLTMGVNPCYTGAGYPCLAFNNGMESGNNPGPGGPPSTNANNIVQCVPMTVKFNWPTFPSPSCAITYDVVSLDPSNQLNVDPGWVNVGNSSPGTETTPPIKANFALTVGSPARGIATHEPYLPTAVRDLGACDRTYNPCGSYP